MTRVRMITPRYASYHESKINAFSGASGIAHRRRQPRDDRLENLVDAGPFLGAREDRAARIEADDLLDLPPGFVRLRAREIDLVDDRDDLEGVLDREVRVGQRLRFHALRGIDQQQRPFARGQRAGDLVREVHVPGRVDQVQHVLLPVVGVVGQPDGVRLDRDAALALEVHRVEDLRFHFTRLERPRDLEKPVCERRLAVIDMGDDGEIAYQALIHGP